MVALLLRLHFVPVREALQPAAFEIIREVEVQISRVKLLVDLVVDKFRYFCVHGFSSRVSILYNDYTVGFDNCKVK